MGDFRKQNEKCDKSEDALYLWFKIIDFTVLEIQFEFKFFVNAITVPPPICHTPIYPENPIYSQFFGHEIVINRESRGFKEKFKM